MRDIPYNLPFNFPDEVDRAIKANFRAAYFRVNFKERLALREAYFRTAFSVAFIRAAFEGRVGEARAVAVGLPPDTPNDVVDSAEGLRRMEEVLSLSLKLKPPAVISPATPPPPSSASHTPGA